jgi:hypothetical protein
VEEIALTHASMLAARAGRASRKFVGWRARVA